MISIWEKETFYAPYDIVIVGSGFVGLWSGFQLKKKNPKLKIAIVDRGIIPTGASTRNAGFACFGSLSEVVYDAQTMGNDKMLHLVEMRYKGLERIQKYFDDNLIDFDMCGGYELFDSSDKVSSGQLQQNIDYINSLFKSITGKKKTYKLVDGNISAFGFANTKHLVKNNLEGYLHSGKLIQALLSKVQGMGVQIFTQTEINSFERINGKIELQTSQPFNLSTSQLLVCTNAFAKELLPEEDVIPARGQVLLTSPVENLPWKGTFHSDEGFYYFRNLGKKVLLGGARNKAFDDERTTDMSTSDFIQSELEKYLNEVVLPDFKGRYTIENRWSGIMAMGGEKMPIVKEIQPNVFCCIRMSGMGVALAPVVSQQVAEMMLGAL
ncbi:MAG TPA: FAD-dependent oxidoreductase [Flavisolibacter sp.]|jgi:glycine/D-amino acid oxidase-like deaminating enzyme|nr:FAD-dependent oxidoreductase [Flavisolibacter sp.]